MRINAEEVIALVKEAGRLFYDNREAAGIHQKGDSDFVTDVDFHVQKFLNEELSARYPSVQMMSEEKDNSDLDRQADFWVLDPVDGTLNLMRHLHQSAVSLGYYEDGIAVFGVVYNPFVGDIYTAEKGRGAFLNGRPIHVSDKKTLKESVVTIGTGPYHKHPKDFEFFAKIYADCIDIRRPGAGSLDLCDVAAGHTEVFFERNLKPWDYAAGKLILEEAGGRIRKWDGSEPETSRTMDTIAGNGYIDEIILRDYMVYEP